MTLSQVKTALQNTSYLTFKLPNGSLVPEHFHVTEVGKIDKNYIDCGGTVRQEEIVSFQLWNANDYNHRLHPEKLYKIIELSEKVLQIDPAKEVEVEYQGDTIQKFGLEFDGTYFLLVSKHTQCLALDLCGIPNIKPKIKLSDLQNNTCCSPNENCC